MRFLALILMVLFAAPVFGKDCYWKIHSGYSTDKVLNKCGPPQYREIISMDTDGGYVPYGSRKVQGAKTSINSRWIYYGERATILIIKDGKVIDKDWDRFD